MSALNIIVTQTVAHVYTDGACCDLDGRLRSAGSKVIAMPHLNAVLAASGTFATPIAFASALTQANASSFDELGDRFETCVVEGLRPAESVGQSKLVEHFTLALVGWSESYNRPLAYVIATHATFGAPMTRAGPFDMLATPDVSVDLAAAGINPTNPAHGVRVMEMQRREKPARSDGGEPFHGIGCFCQETIVARDGIATRIRHRWADRTGGEILSANRRSLCA